MIVFFGTRLAKILIWQKKFYTVESDFNILTTIKNINIVTTISL